MEILIAKTAGFCFGVKRAIKLAEECPGEANGDISTLGPLIHNPQAVAKLEESNIIAKGSVDEIDSGTVIIRSHGVELSEYKLAGEKGLTVVDATCPFVTKAQQFVSSLTEEGYDVIVVGEGDHPEVQGLISYGGPRVRVVTGPEDLKGMARAKKIGIVAQTTQNIRNLESVTAFCLSKASEIKVYNTICNATSLRQAESVELAENVDLMIVVGGKNSANTKRLAEICESIQPNTHHIEVATEIEEDWRQGALRVGITAGASTPGWVIEDVVSKIQQWT